MNKRGLYFFGLFFFCLKFCVNLQCNENVENKKFEQMYEYVKDTFINKNNLTSKEYKELETITDLISNNSNKRRSERSDLTKEEQRKKELERKMKSSNHLENIFNAIIEKSNLFEIFKERKNPWGVNVLKNLNILKYNEKEGFISQIINDKNELINVMNALRIVAPEEDIENNVKKLQAFIDLEDFDELANLLTELSEAEEEFISLYSNKNSNKRFELGDDLYNAYITFEGKNVKEKSVLNKKFRNLFLNPPFIILSTIHVIPAIALKSIDVSLQMLGFKTCGKCGKGKGVFLVSDIIFAGLNYFLFFLEGKKIYEYFNPGVFYDRIKKKFKAIKKYLTTLEKIYNFIQTKEEIFPLFKDYLLHCRNLFIDREGFQKEQKEMLDLLKLIPQDWKYWKHWGKARARNLCKFILLFDKYKGMFIDPMCEMAYLLSNALIAKSLKDKNNHGKICLPNVINQKNPYINLKKVYNPIQLDIVEKTNKTRPSSERIKLVTNDIELGKSEKNKISIIVMPQNNGSGKTTMIKSVGITLLTAQAFGICYAESAVLTRFKQLYTMMEVMTDAHKSSSHFASVLESFDELFNIVYNLNENEFCLVLSDETPDGSSDNDFEAELLTNIIKFLAKNDNILAIISTQNKNIVEIAKEYENIENYSMDYDLKNGLEFKYTLIKGYRNDNLGKELIKKFGREGKIKYYEEILGRQFDNL